jgi:hypothetical protein
LIALLFVNTSSLLDIAWQSSLKWASHSNFCKCLLIGKLFMSLLFILVFFSQTLVLGSIVFSSFSFFCFCILHLIKTIIR